jgi:hypothetical protein
MRFDPVRIANEERQNDVSGVQCSVASPEARRATAGGIVLDNRHLELGMGCLGLRHLDEKSADGDAAGETRDTRHGAQ